MVTFADKYVRKIGGVTKSLPNLDNKSEYKLLLAGTDSLAYKMKNNSIETNDFYEEFYKDKDLFDFSEYPQDSNFLVIGKIKDEFKGKIISEFVGLKSKMYLSTDVYNEEDKRATEVDKNNVKNKRHKKISWCFI